MNMATTNLAERVSLRRVVLPDDEEFLIRLYFTTRDDINFLPLEEAQKKSILMMQYQAQRQQYEAQFPDSRHDIVLLDGEPVGRFWTMREETEIRGIDLALLPEHRNSGIGSCLLAEIFEEAAQTNRDFTFHVLKTNRAMRLYQRLGCEFTGETVSHFSMRRRPPDK